MRRRLRLLLLAGIFPFPLRGQASPYIPLDHPLLPLIEHLIARGDLRDPSPMIRPFRRSDLLRAIDSAALDSTSASGRIAAQLRARFTDRTDQAWWRVAPRVGAQGFSSARRDLLHPGGAGGVRAYGDVSLEGRFGSLILASRLAAENRLKLDPDWSGAQIQQHKREAYRFIDAYIAAQFKWARLFYGQMDRNWGPAGLLGIGLSNYGYPRSDIGFDLVLRGLQINVVATQLSDEADSTGAIVKRYFMAHRLNLRPWKNLNLAIWETGVLAGRDKSFEPSFRNPLTLLSFPAQFGIQDDRNTMIGGDLEWRPGRRLVFQVQAAIDDRWRSRPDATGTGEPAHPGRWAFTLAAGGGLGGAVGWRTHLAMVSSLAFHTAHPTENFTDRGIGIGPEFIDNYTAGLELTVPVRGRWLLAPDLTLLRQGEGRIDAPFPAGAAYTATPELFIGTVATTWRLGASLVGSAGPVALAGTGGVFTTSNADHVPGRTRTRLEGRLQATLGFSVGGGIQ